MRNWKMIASIMCTLAIMVTAGCATTPDLSSLRMSPVTPAANEQIVRDQLVILVDASGSLGSTDEFECERDFLNAFVQAMPKGTYETSVNSFGGVPSKEWLREASSPFDRATLLDSVSSLKMLGGVTPLARGIRGLEPEFAGRSCRSALLVCSDGRARPHKAALDACQALQESHSGELCIYTVHVGNSSQGKKLLDKMVSTAGCGKSWEAASLNSSSAIESMVRDIFLGAKPVPAAAPKAAPVVPVEPLDSDKDGVYDDADQCPNTPLGAKVDARGCWVLKGLNFDNDSAVVKPIYDALLDEVATVLKNNPNVRIRVDGHTDSKSSDAYNLKLSERRATAVKEALIKRGVDTARLETKGFGESQILVPDTSEENMLTNRRVELSVIQ